MASSSENELPSFYKEKHIKYWLRCLKTYLPTGYTPNDSNRMTLASFVLSALDLLGVLQERTTESERDDYIDWIYHCQLPDGGFRGFTGTDLGRLRTAENEHWDPANLAATYFALAGLLILGDGLERVKRSECLNWLARLQYPDGSIGEVLGENGTVEGGGDPRFCFMGLLVRWLLSDEGDKKTGEGPDIDVDRLAGFIESARVSTNV